MRLILAFVLLCSAAVGGEAKGNSATDEKVQKALKETVSLIPVAIKQRADVVIDTENRNTPFMFYIKYWVEQFSIEQIKIDCNKIVEVSLKANESSGLNKHFVVVYAGHFFNDDKGKEMVRDYGVSRYNPYKDELTFIKGWE